MDRDQPQGNPLLIAARRAHGWYSQTEFAEAFNLRAYDLGERAAISVRQVRRWESAAPPWPRPDARRVLVALFGKPIEQLGLVPPHTPSAEAREDEPVNRRDFVTASLSAIAARPLPKHPAEFLDAAPPNPLDRVRAQLSHAPADGRPQPPRDLARAVGAAKRHVQACRYGVLMDGLPKLLSSVRASQDHAPNQPDVQGLAVHAYHVAASLLLKNGDAASAWIAADRAMTAARATGNPLPLAAASRILVHAMAAVGHQRDALQVAVRSADAFTPHVRSTAPETVAVYGALLLRGSWAASVARQPASANALLDEAQRVARLSNGDGNAQWTAFGPTNVALHRVSVALAQGDAGTALNASRSVDVAQLEVTERRAVFWLDCARALHACGRTQQASHALLAAEDQAPEEIRSRKVAKDLISELIHRDRLGRVPELRSLAVRAGVGL